jgi:hypothetical protein
MSILQYKYCNACYINVINVAINLLIFNYWNRMSKNAAGVEPHLKVVARPSLYATDMPPNATDKHVSILASLEPESPERQISRARLLSISIALLMIGLIYWAYVNAIFQQPLSMPAWMETALNISKAPIPVVPPNAQVVAAKPDSPVVVAVEEPRPAIIVTESAPTTSVEAVVSKSDVSDKLAKLDQESANKKSVDPQPAQLPVVAKTADTQKSASNENAAHKNTVAPKVDAKLADTTHTSKQPKTEAAKNAKDEDVDLIAALLSRVSHQDAAAKDAKNKKAGTATVSNPNGSVAKRQTKTDPNRDIVTRADNDTTEGLLKRCKALGFFEGELCRVRICSKLWGKDPACPAPEQAALPSNIN